MCHGGVRWVMDGWCEVGCVMEGWGGVCDVGMGWAVNNFICHKLGFAGVWWVGHVGVGWGGSCRGGVGWVM